MPLVAAFDGLRETFEFFFLIMTQILQFVLCIEQRKENRVTRREVIEDCADTAALAARTTTPSSLSKSPCATDYRIRKRIGGNASIAPRSSSDSSRLTCF